MAVPAMVTQPAQPLQSNKVDKPGEGGYDCLMAKAFSDQLVEGGTVVGPARVLEACLPTARGKQPTASFEKALKLLLECGSRRVRVVLSGDGAVPKAWLKALEEAEAWSKGKEFECVLRRGTAIAPRRPAMGWTWRTRLCLRGEHAACLLLSAPCAAGVPDIEFPGAAGYQAWLPGSRL